MSNDRHTPDMARKMASAAGREPLARDDRRREELERERIDERGHIDAREMASQQRNVSDARELTDDRPMPMFAGAEAAGYRTQWDAIQTGFVDEPRKAVQEAD